MNGGFLVVKSQGSADGVTDALELVSDAAFKANKCRELANGLFSGASSAGGTGEAGLSGVRRLLELTDAGLLVTLSDADVPAPLMRVMVAGAAKSDAVVIRADSGEIVLLSQFN